MDITKIEQTEEKRQEFIKSQKGDGEYNPITGVYKWGENVYDLTKTNGEICIGYPPIRSKIFSYERHNKNR